MSGGEVPVRVFVFVGVVECRRDGPDDCTSLGDGKWPRGQEVEECGALGFFGDDVVVVAFAEDVNDPDETVSGELRDVSGGGEAVGAP